nr:di-heme-cytochrome C peroxidase [Hahella ganghwensis]
MRLPFSDLRFADPDHMRRYRFLVDSAPTQSNPDQLPVGFTKHYDPNTGDNVLDVTCAACHNGQLSYTKDGKTYAIRIDGGQAMHAISDTTRGAFAPMLIASLVYTAVNPFKFDEFAKGVLGGRYPDGKSNLRSQLWTSIKQFVTSPQNNPLKHLYPVVEGYGRTDALGRIGNTVFGDHLVSSNYQVGAAPVSYPYVWNIWKFDWVQYNGSVAQPLARNIGEALGVGARIPLLNDTGGPLPPEERFRSSVRIADLQKIEHTLQTLQAPKWPEDLFGKVDQSLATQGEQLFMKNCRGCHGPHPANAAQQKSLAPLKPGPEVEWKIEVIPVSHIGTDESTAKGFLERRYDLSRTGVTNEDIGNTLRPLLYRQLIREVRYRLTEVIDIRQAQGLNTGDLANLLDQYPEQSPVVELPTALFTSIKSELSQLVSPLPNIPDARTAPSDSYRCNLTCQTIALLWNIEHGQEYAEIQMDALNVKQLTEGEALNIVGLMIKNRFYADFNVDFDEQQCLEGFGTLDLPQQVLGYKPRPLEGGWSTPPFLHNGSVPSIYQLLSPPETRSSMFLLGQRDYDPVNLGYTLITRETEGVSKEGFWMDTSIEGNLNTGHAFAADPDIWAQHKQSPKEHPLPQGVIGPVLTHDERMAILEYLKVHQDTPATPADYQPPECQLLGKTL